MSPNGTRRRMRRNGPSSVSYRKPDGAWKEVPGHAGGKIWAIVDDEARATGNYNAVVYKDEGGEWSGELYFTRFPLRPEDRVSAEAAKRVIYDEWYRREDEMARSSAEDRAETAALEKTRAKKIGRGKAAEAWRKVAFATWNPKTSKYEAYYEHKYGTTLVASSTSKSVAEQAAKRAGERELASRASHPEERPVVRKPTASSGGYSLRLRQTMEATPPRARRKR